VSGFGSLGLGLLFDSLSLGLWLWVSGSGSLGLGLWVWVSGFGSLGLVLWVWGSGSGPLGLGPCVWVFGIWFGSLGLDLWVWVSRYGSLGLGWLFRSGRVSKFGPLGMGLWVWFGSLGWVSGCGSHQMPLQPPPTFCPWPHSTLFLAPPVLNLRNGGDESVPRQDATGVTKVTKV
jgi:hypothetical protein